ncbi:MAG TPA: hypothetical protein VN837_05535 [Chloroflexota bacterium]|nr:hypothetical protein [Chloroflexota bacterium]
MADMRDTLARLVETINRARAQAVADADPPVQCLPDHHQWQRDPRPDIADPIFDLMPSLVERQRCTRCGMTRRVDAPPTNYDARHMFRGDTSKDHRPSYRLRFSPLEGEGEDTP